jgi:hypothetical protein
MRGIGADIDLEINIRRVKRKKREAKILRKEGDMRFLRIIKATLTLVAFVLVLGTSVFPADKGKENGLATMITQQTDQQKKELSEDPAYLAWKKKYDENKQEFDKSKKTISIGMIATGGGLLITVLSSVIGTSSGNDYGLSEAKTGLAGVLIGGVVTTIGSGIWIYGALKRHSAKEEMEVLMDEGRIKGYIRASIIPSIDFQAQYYAVTFTITF